jgi:hypothetical protein
VKTGHGPASSGPFSFVIVLKALEIAAPSNMFQTGGETEQQ